MRDFTQFSYHILFEPEFDETPVIRVYENYLDFDGETNCDTAQVVDRYDFTDTDVDFVLAALNIDSIEELRIDEWFDVYSFAKREWLPAQVTAWVEDQYEGWVGEFLKVAAR